MIVCGAKLRFKKLRMKIFAKQVLRPLKVAPTARVMPAIPQMRHCSLMWKQGDQVVMVIEQSSRVISSATCEPDKCLIALASCFALGGNERSRRVSCIATGSRGFVWPNASSARVIIERLNLTATDRTTATRTSATLDNSQWCSAVGAPLRHLHQWMMGRCLQI